MIHLLTKQDKADRAFRRWADAMLAGSLGTRTAPLI